MERIWWERISKVNHWVDMVTSKILSGKCILLESPSFLPWHDVMYNTVHRTLLDENASCSLKFIDNPNESDAGKFLFDTFCPKAVRTEYRSNVSYASFLAEREDIPFNSYYVWVKNVPGNDINKWLTFVSDYNTRIKANGNRRNRAIFIIETDDCSLYKTGVKGLCRISFSDSIEYYDKFTFCALATGSMELCGIKPCLRPYLVELITTVCGDEIELYPECIKRAADFLSDPVGTLDCIMLSFVRSDGNMCILDEDTERLNMLIWEAQVKLIFPAVEKFRSDFVRRHYDEIAKVLPCENGFGMEVKTPYEVEVNLLLHLASQKRLIVGKSELDNLELFKNARNSISHLVPLSFEMVEGVLSRI